MKQFIFIRNYTELIYYPILNFNYIIMELKDLILQSDSLCDEDRKWWLEHIPFMSNDIKEKAIKLFLKEISENKRLDEKY